MLIYSISLSSHTKFLFYVYFMLTVAPGGNNLATICYKDFLGLATINMYYYYYYYYYSCLAFSLVFIRRHLSFCSLCCDKLLIFLKVCLHVYAFSLVRLLNTVKLRLWRAAENVARLDILRYDGDLLQRSTFSQFILFGFPSFLSVCPTYFIVPSCCLPIALPIFPCMFSCLSSKALNEGVLINSCYRVVLALKNQGVLEEILVE